MIKFGDGELLVNGEILSNVTDVNLQESKFKIRSKKEFLEKVKCIIESNPGRKVNMHFTWAEWAKIEGLWDEETMCVLGDKVNYE